MSKEATNAVCAIAQIAFFLVLPSLSGVFLHCYLFSEYIRQVILVWPQNEPNAGALHRPSYLEFPGEF
jgi:hypothetical protein